tara:strand:+ start:214833 stop:215207 length:375 start_codon:yes stop_codon:yes gene_type:complete
LVALAHNQTAIATNILASAPKIASPHLPWPWGVSAISLDMKNWKQINILTLSLLACLIPTILFSQQGFVKHVYGNNLRKGAISGGIVLNQSSYLYKELSIGVNNYATLKHVDSSGQSIGHAFRQ